MPIFSTRVSRRRAIAATGFSSLLLVASLAGCSGSGSTSSSGAAASTRAAAPLNVYVTDDLTVKYSQVIVTLYGVDVSTDGGTTWTSVYTDATGATIDLASLSQSAQLLSSVTLPSGTITNVRLTFSDSVTLTPAGGGTTQTVTVASSGSNITVSGGNAIVTYATSTTLTAGKLSNLVADFKLASFQLTGTNLMPAIGPCDSTSFNNKHKMAFLPGTVANLVAGTSFTLDLAGPKTSALTVDLTSTTSITSAGSTSAGATTAATLADGDSVQVQGTVDPATGIVTADSVTIVPATSTSTATPTPAASGSGSSAAVAPTISAVGSVQSVDATSGDFVLQIHHGEHFSRAIGGGVTVATTSSTVFESGQSAITLSGITVGSSVAVVGTFDPTTGTLTATNVILLPSGS